MNKRLKKYLLKEKQRHFIKIMRGKHGTIEKTIKVEELTGRNYKNWKDLGLVKVELISSC